MWTSSSDGGTLPLLRRREKKDSVAWPPNDGARFLDLNDALSSISFDATPLVKKLLRISSLHYSVWMDGVGKTGFSNRKGTNEPNSRELQKPNRM